MLNQMRELFSPFLVLSSAMVTSLLSLALTRHRKQPIKSDIENNRLEENIILLYVVLL
eukprot:CAMPEP_0113618896 /NCGR_PEP_ID=MMETSP0017_2-20120614/9584_1 /TAXON_ID=2856 /ORGANISM="Cylindrotheca closterium" /LENGTH=57 /DNA_ID=CAMNT_0000528441 /DNA_START=38 /DNA_END=208 /DNA_ORIENTATION=- /assembly_acc=CAM_ASM_000147